MATGTAFDKIELSLIRVLHTVITEQSVSRAAMKLGTSQPAVSGQLKRLRTLVNDPLLVRAGSGMAPTAVALSLLPAAAQVLQGAQALFGGHAAARAFAPEAATQTFRIAASDYLDPLFLPELVARVRAQAPGVSLELLPLTGDYDYRARLARGEVDVVIGNWLQPPAELHLGRLIADEIVCLVAREHAAVRSPRGWTAERYLGSEHIAPTPLHAGGRGIVDEHLQAQGLQRRIVVRCPHFGLAPAMVARSQLVLTTGRQFCARYVGAVTAAAATLRIVRCPVEFPPLVYYQLWHDLTHASPPARWPGPAHDGVRRHRRRAQAVAIHADLLDFTGDPGLADRGSAAVRYRPDHWLLIDASGRIAGVSAEAPGEDWRRVDHRGRLLTPGFIDSHVHSAQVDVIASWGAQLLDWLETYTFPAESRLADGSQAEASAALFLDALLAHGTTSAAVFPTVHVGATEALLAGAQTRGMRLIAGKVLMDRHAPEALRDDVLQAERDCRALIARWHGHGRIAYAVTPRFAATSSPEQLAMAGRLLRDHPGVYLQTHVAENRAEVAWIAELFPESRSYLDVYAQHGLLNERSVLAHGIWLDDSDRAVMRDSGAQIAFCPSSNLFLGSGLFGWAAAREAGVAVSLASDVGGGTSLSMLRTMADGYKVQALAGQRLSAWALLHAATRGAAQALRLGSEIGALEPGLMADVCVWDWAVGAVARRRDALAQQLHERVFAWMTLGDERNLAETWVAGLCRYRRA